MLENQILKYLLVVIILNEWKQDEKIFSYSNMFLSVIVECIR
jgi:hypothetical protein